jgi:pyruvate dehydrogenase E2 component (dihydrolipoamide acetyltransferase)
VVLPKVTWTWSPARSCGWKVAEGDYVSEGDILFEMETNKAMMEVEAPGTGVIRDLAPVTDQPVAVGTVVAWIHPEST